METSSSPLSQLQEKVKELLASEAATGSIGMLLTTIAALLAASSTSGECRVLTPFAPIKPVIGSDGTFKWCCTHSPEHCAAG